MDKEVLYCVNHPDRETLLRCNKCGKPICTECAVRHPVGLRCRECAQLRRLPIYEVSWKGYSLSLVVGLLVATLSVFLGNLLMRALFLPFIGWFIPWILAAAIGVALGESMSWAAGYKRGRGLQILAGLCATLGYFLANSVPLLFLTRSWAFAFGWVNLYTLFYLLITIAFAVGRLR